MYIRDYNLCIKYVNRPRRRDQQRKNTIPRAPPLPADPKNTKKKRQITQNKNIQKHLKCKTAVTRCFAKCFKNQEKQYKNTSHVKLRLAAVLQKASKNNENQHKNT